MRQHFEEGRTRPPLLVWLTESCSFKTFQWNVLNALYFHRHTKAATSLLLGIFSLAENPTFATRCEIHPLDALKARSAKTKRKRLAAK